MAWNKTIYFMSEEIIKGDVKIKPEVQLQCPLCRHSLEKSEETYRCPFGHVELETTSEGYPIPQEAGISSRQLAYGGNFKEGMLWQKTLSRCKKVVYLASSKDQEDELKPLRDHLNTLEYEFRVIYLDELNKLNINKQTVIIFSYRIGRKNTMEILLKYLWDPVYRYIPGTVVRMRLSKLIRQGLSASIYKVLLATIAPRRVEAYYERYLSDRKTAEHFAATYLPQEIQNGKGKHVFDIGCGRGRHSAILGQLGFSITGMDLKPHPYWRRISKANFIVGSAECLPYIPDATFDLVNCMQVLMYLADDDAALVHIKRVLKREGYFLLQVTNKENLHTLLTKEPLAPDPYLQRYYKQSEICEKLKKHGFIIDRAWTEKLYTPFFVMPGNILYDFVLGRPLRTYWDRLVPSRYLGMINILARPS
jgi:SAM-dependent methyltransferase